MNDNIREFKPLKQKVSEDAISLLEELLSEAKAGNIIAVGVAIIRPHGFIASVTSEVENTGSMIGAMELLKYRFISQVLEVIEPC